MKSLIVQILWKHCDYILLIMGLTFKNKRDMLEYMDEPIKNNAITVSSALIPQSAGNEQ